MATTTTITGAEFDAMPYDEGRRWELVDGELISVPSPTPRHQDIVFEILLAVRRYLQKSRIAGLAYQDVEFALAENDRVRPDVGVVPGEKATRLDPDKTPIPGAPDIAIEVISPSERASESHDKVRAYLRNGTAEVWQVYPKSRTVLIHRGEVARSSNGASRSRPACCPVSRSGSHRCSPEDRAGWGKCPAAPAWNAPIGAAHSGLCRASPRICSAYASGASGNGIAVPRQESYGLRYNRSLHQR